MIEYKAECDTLCGEAWVCYCHHNRQVAAVYKGYMWFSQKKTAFACMRKKWMDAFFGDLV